MADKTTNYNLTKPSADDFYDVGVQNGNMDIIDEVLYAHASNVIKHNSATAKGGALGDSATTTNGGAIGNDAIAGAGGAVGEGTKTNSGGVVGYNATSNNGGAVGESAKAQNGGAVGYLAKTAHGCAIGHQAVTAKEDGTLIDAIQLGTGTNTVEKTLQAYGYRLMNANGTIPTERIPNMAKIAIGTYQGANSKTKTLTGIPFVANLILIFEGNNTSPTAKYKLAIVNGVSQTIPLWETDGQRCDVTWDGKVPTWSSSASNATSAYAIAMNSSGSTYYWFAFGKGEGA